MKTIELRYYEKLFLPNIYAEVLQSIDLTVQNLKTRRSRSLRLRESRSAFECWLDWVCRLGHKVFSNYILNFFKADSPLWKLS